MKQIYHQTDLCIIGGGMAGLCAAIAAARNGAHVILMQDRPMLGGNASSEIRMHICGADRFDGKSLRESGIIEEIELENLYRNPLANYQIWDSVLYGKALEQDNLTLLLNCSCNNAIMDKSTIISVKGWQTTSETWHTVESQIFADCSGDSVLAPLTGAEFRIGREGRYEHNETIEPEEPDKKTMGMSCLIQTRVHDEKIEFIPPKWAAKLTGSESLHTSQRNHNMKNGTNFWWLEMGGEGDSIHDTEHIRDELLPLAFGIWDHIKNDGDHEADNLSLEWVGFLPGKRESRRYIGDYVLNQNDVESGGHFEDVVAYGGWSMDDHNPAGFYYDGEPTIFHPAPQPYGIPYRSLYSKNIENLMFAGRNISATHAANSSTRVMGTCSILGQAMGTAAAIAVKKNTTPRGVYENYIKDLQKNLLEDGCWLPGHKKEISHTTLMAKLTSDTKDEVVLFNGIERNFVSVNNWAGSFVALEWEKPICSKTLRLVFDSELERLERNMPHKWHTKPYNRKPPKSLVRDFDVEIKKNGKWKTIHQIRDNHKRHIKLPLDYLFRSIRISLIRNWNDQNKVNIFSIEIQ